MGVYFGSNHFYRPEQVLNHISVSPSSTYAKMTRSNVRIRMVMFAILGILFLALTFVAIDAYSSDTVEAHHIDLNVTTLSEDNDIKSLQLKHVVLPGDTLWSIAQQYKPVKKEIRQYIYEIKRTNQLTTSPLNIGQVIVLP